MLLFLFSPVQFFEARLHRVQGWGWPVALPVLCAVLHSAAVLIFAGKMRPVLEAAFLEIGISTSTMPPANAYAVVALVGYPMTYALAAVALIALDVVLIDSGQARRLGQFAGLCFLSQLPIAFSW